MQVRIFYHTLRGSIFAKQRMQIFTVYISIISYISCMAKKIPRNKKKTLKRSSSIEKTIEEGRQFVAAATKRRREPRKTKTMMQIVKEGKKSLPKKTPPKKTPSKPAKPLKSAKKKPFSGRKIISKKISPIKVTPKKQKSGKKMTEAKSSMKVTKLKASKSRDMAIPSYGYIDVCFCVDATGSMSSQIAQVQSTITSIIENIQGKVRTEGLNLRFAIVTYRDHPPQDSTYVTKVFDFTDNFQAINYVKTLNAWGGGDEPEAVHDGLMDCATKLNWAQVVGSPTLRYIFHVADAPPHGSEFKNPESNLGCLCGMQTDDVIREINKKQIHYRLVKVRNNFKVDEMEKIFKAKVANFDSTDIQHAREMNVKVSDMIIHEVIPDFA